MMGATIEIVMAVLFARLVQQGRMEERWYLCRVYSPEFAPWRILGHPGLLEELKNAALQPVTQPAFCGLVQDREAIEERDVVFREGVGVLWNQRGMDPPSHGVRRIEAEERAEEREGGHCA
jgi:hypothetical protein